MKRKQKKATQSDQETLGNQEVLKLLVAEFKKRFASDPEWRDNILDPLYYPRDPVTQEIVPWAEPIRSSELRRRAEKIIGAIAIVAPRIVPP